MKLELRPTLKLVVSPRLVQLLKLLQLPRLDLEQLVRAEMEENPLLEEVPQSDDTAEAEGKDGEKEEFDWAEYLQDDLDPYYGRQEPSSPPPIEETVVYDPSLRDYLLTQLHVRPLSEEEIKIGEFIIDSLDEDGYLSCSVEALAQTLGVEVEETERVLRVVQSFDPLGIGAKDLPECLLIQLGELGKGEGLEAQVIRHYLDDLTQKRYDKIAKALKVEKNEVKTVAELISTLSPKPARGRWGGGSKYVVPDILVERSEEGYRMTLNEMNIPSLRVSHSYVEVLKNPRDFSEREVNFIRERLSRARSFVSSLEERRDTILKVADYIVQEQKEFFSEGVSHLKPMTLRTVAEAVGVHESTVSRVVHDKWVDTPKGVYPLKFLFGGGFSRTTGGEVSVKSIKETIKNLIEHEDKKHPLTDSSIVKVLSQEGLKIARRTVSKYREELGISSSKLRKEA